MKTSDVMDGPPYPQCPHCERELQTVTVNRVSGIGGWGMRPRLIACPHCKKVVAGISGA